jgi:hypothetical protein
MTDGEKTVALMTLISEAQEAARHIEAAGDSPELVRRLRDACYAMNVAIHNYTHEAIVVDGKYVIRELPPGGLPYVLHPAWNRADEVKWNMEGTES